VNTPAQGVVGIPFFDEYVEKAHSSISTARQKAASVLHECQLHEGPPAEHAAPDFIHKSMSKSKYADSVIENDTRIGRIVDRVRALGLDKNSTYSGPRQRRLADVYPDAGYTPFRGTKAPCARAAIGFRPSPGPRIKAGSRNYDIVGGLDYMATFAALAGVKLPDRDRAASPSSSIATTCHRSCSARASRAHLLVLLHRERADPAPRAWATTRRVQLRGDNGASTGGLAVDTNLGWKGGEKYVAVVPRCSISGRTRRSATTSS